jgi:maleylpyruvate isomerase
LPEEKVTEWAAWVNREGLSACEALIKGEQGTVLLRRGADGCGPLPGAAACERAALRRRCRSLSAPARGRSRDKREIKAFADAAPDRQPDAE